MTLSPPVREMDVIPFHAVAIFEIARSGMQGRERLALTTSLPHRLVLFADTTVYVRIGIGHAHDCRAEGGSGTNGDHQAP